MGYFIHEDQPAGLPLANLDELNDANISSPADKDVLSYDATTQKWVNDSSINSNINTKVQTVAGTPLKVFWMREKNVTFTSGAGSINLLNNVPAEYQNMSLFNAIVQCDSTSGSVILSATSNTNGVVSMVLKSVSDGSGITANVKVNIIFALY